MRKSTVQRDNEKERLRLINDIQDEVIDNIHKQLKDDDINFTSDMSQTFKKGNKVTIEHRMITKFYNIYLDKLKGKEKYIIKYSDKYSNNTEVFGGVYSDRDTDKNTDKNTGKINIIKNNNIELYYDDKNNTLVLPIKNESLILNIL